MEYEKLYSPLEFQLRDNDYLEYYDNNEYWRDEMLQWEALPYFYEIKDFIEVLNKRDDPERGLIAYTHKDVLNNKVHSLKPNVEIHDDKIWMVAEIILNEPLTEAEMQLLKDEWRGQLSDGWGESLEQRELEIDRGELYLEPWTSTNRFFIDTQKEFCKRIGIEELENIPAKTPVNSNLSEKEFLTQSIKLSARLEDNFLSFNNSLEKRKKIDIIHNATEIAAVHQAFEYLSDEHKYTLDEISYLLKFENPLIVVSDASKKYQDKTANHFETAITNELATQELLKGGKYKLIDIAAEKTTNSVLVQLRDSAKKNKEMSNKKTNKTAKRSESER